MKKNRRLFTVSCIVLVLFMTACDTAFQQNPHGPTFIDGLNATAVPSVPTGTVLTVPHFPPAGFGSTLVDLVAQYGAPTGYSSPPLYSFLDHGQTKWPQGSLIVVTVKNDRAVEFSYDPGSDHPMTFQEAQDFATKLLPDDATGPVTIQKEDDQAGKCLAKTYQSKLLTSLFKSDDFMSTDGKDGNPGTVTVNFFPDLNFSTDTTHDGQDGFSTNQFLNHNQVSSILVNLGSKPTC